MKWPLVRPDGAVGMILTFLSVTLLVTLGIAGIATVVYAAFWLGSALMMGCLVMAAIGLPIAWLEYSQR